LGTLDFRAISCYKLFIEAGAFRIPRPVIDENCRLSKLNTASLGADAGCLRS